jgi:hypothetical protein
MKIHMRPPLPPLPPPAPPKAPPTPFEMELTTEALIKIAQQQRTWRSKMKNVRRNPRRRDKDADSDGSDQDGRPRRTTVDFLV